MNVRDLGLNGPWVVQWESYIDNLKYDGIKLNPKNDTLVWSGIKINGYLTTKLAYEYMIRKGNNSDQIWWYKC